MTETRGTSDPPVLGRHRPLASLGMALTGALLLALLTLLVAGGTLDALDRRWLETVAGTSGPRAVACAGWITWLGSSRYVHPAVLLAALLFWRRGLREHAVVLATAGYGASATTFLLKRLVDRARPVPDEALHAWLPASPAFPSGHATNAMVLALFLLWLASRAGTTRMAWLAALALPLALLVLWSRLVLQVHWPSDLLGGTLVALLWIGLATFLLAGTDRPGGREARHETGPPPP